MTDHIIELTDPDLRISGPEAALAASPGFASLTEAGPVFGEAARARFRLEPRRSFNQFWSQLSLEPLANTSDYFRHQADLAYGHLDSLAREHALSGDAIFAIPGHYSRNQLAILLGLVKALPIRATGLVDLALAACAARVGAEQAVYLDMQLHQAVVTRIIREGDNLRRDTVSQIPGAGLQALYDAWSALITDAFIKQSRFDPRHNAETEQYIHDRLPDWLARVRDGEALMEINHRDTLYQATLSRGYFEQKARPLLMKIRQELEHLAGPEAERFMAAPMSSLPGLSLYLPGFEPVDEDAVAATCFRHREAIEGDPEALGFTTRLPAAAPARRAAAGNRPDAPSHVLVNHRAYPLPASMLRIGPRQMMGSGAGTDFIELEDPALTATITISRSEQGYRLETNGLAGLRINGEPPGETQPLALGDRINLVDSGINIQLIQVR